jgi:sugar/nucleoside kinase (ribokinase family)
MGRRRRVRDADATLLRSATLAVGTEEELAAASGPLTSPTGRRDAARQRHPGADPQARRARLDDLPSGRRAADVAPFPIEVLNVLGAGDAFASDSCTATCRAGRSSAPRAWATPAARSS